MFETRSTPYEPPTRRVLTAVAVVLLAFAAALAAGPLGAQQPAPARAPAAPPSKPAASPASADAAGTAAASEPLPTAAEILQRNVAALGGEAAIRKHRHLTWKGTFAMPGMGLEGTLVLHASAPNLFQLTIEAGSLGTITQGYDGKVGWSDNPMTGPTVTTGAELELLAIQSDFYTDLHYTEHYPKIAVAGREDFAGEPCYQVALTTAGGVEMFNYFSVATGLLVGATGDLPTPMGKIFVETEIGGYQEFDGRFYPTMNRQKAMGTEQVLTLSEVDFSEIDPSVYALPEAIKTLVAAPQPR